VHILKDQKADRKHADSSVAPNIKTEEPNGVLQTYAEAPIGVREQATSHFFQFTSMVLILA
jgi:hypothetical protein